MVDENNIVPGGAPEGQPAPEQQQPAPPQQQRGDRGDRGGRGGGGGGPRGRRRPEPEVNYDAQSGEELVEKVVFINRSAKVVKGGRRFNFSALVVVGDKKGRVGVGMGKAGEVADAIRKGGESARGNMVGVSLRPRRFLTKSFIIIAVRKFCSAPASPGTGIIAGKTVRSVLESAGINRHSYQIDGFEERGERREGDAERVVEPPVARGHLQEPRTLEIKKVETPKAPGANPAA